MRNYEVDIGTMKCLRYLLPLHLSLKELSFHNAGMSSGTISLLAATLPLCVSIFKLQIDYNPLSDPTIFSKFLAANMPARTLSLRGNGLRNLGACAVADAIAWNTWTLTLNLFDNQIGDKGGAAIFSRLRYNVMLKSLSLSKNKCGDGSFKALLDMLIGSEINELEKAEFIEHASQLIDLNKYIMSGKKLKPKAGALLPPNDEEIPLLENILTVNQVDIIKGNRFIETINLSNNKITDKAARAAIEAFQVRPDLPELGMNASFREMNLSQNGIDNKLGIKLSLASRERVGL